MSKPSNGAMKCAKEYNDGWGRRALEEDAHFIDLHVQPLVDALEKIVDCYVDNPNAPAGRVAGEISYGDLRTALAALREWKEGK